MHENCSYSLSLQQKDYNPSANYKEQKAGTLQTNHAYARVLVYASRSSSNIRPPCYTPIPAHFQTTSTGDTYTKMAFKRSVSYAN
jgi:hypothetical protein